MYRNPMQRCTKNFQIVITISLKRNATYYVAVIVIPTFLLVTVCILGLFGPKPDSDIGPEKVSMNS
jgi:hypothetical protein